MERVGSPYIEGCKTALDHRIVGAQGREEEREGRGEASEDWPIAPHFVNEQRLF